MSPNNSSRTRFATRLNSGVKLHNKHRRDMQKMIIVILLAIAAFAVLSLASGSTYLEVMLPGGLPLGNVLSALAPCAIAGATVLLSAPRTALRVVSVTSLIAAVTWLPASVVLAGNLALNFSGWRGSVWFAYTIAVAVVALGSLVLALVASLFAIRRRAGASSRDACAIGESGSSGCVRLIKAVLISVVADALALKTVRRIRR